MNSWKPKRRNAHPGEAGRAIGSPCRRAYPIAWATTKSRLGLRGRTSGRNRYSTLAQEHFTGLSQAAISRRLSRLEGSLGVHLFVRGSHQLRLSKAGARLLPEARAHLDALMQALAAARAAGPDGIAGRRGETVRKAGP